MMLVLLRAASERRTMPEWEMPEKDRNLGRSLIARSSSLYQVRFNVASASFKTASIVSNDMRSLRNICCIAS